MRLIVGLGNPDKEYERTRHNTGFRAVDALAKRLGVTAAREKFHALVAPAEIHGEKVLLMKPLTYMNESGLAVREACDFYKIDPRDVLVIYDDMDLAVGQIRLREKGSNGGHNGIRSIIGQLGTEEIKRIRIGIGSRGIIPGADYVLGKFSAAEEALMGPALAKAAEAAEAFAYEPYDRVMNRYNGSL